MHPYPGGRRRKRVHALRQKPQDDPAENISRACGGERCRSIAVDDRAAVGGRDDGVGALQHDDRSAAVGGSAGARQLVARGVEDAFEFAVMRRDDAGPANRVKEFVRTRRKYADGISIEHHGSARLQQGERPLARRIA